MKLAKSFKNASASVVAICALFSMNANANFLKENQMEVGFQNSFLSGGISVKAPFGEKLSAQGVLGFAGSLTSYSARGIYQFSQYSNTDVYAFGSAGLWTFNGGRGIGTESVFGLGVGVGIDYNLQQAFPDLPPLNLSAEIGSSFASFDTFAGFNVLSLGFGLHYQF